MFIKMKNNNREQLLAPVIPERENKIARGKRYSWSKHSHYGNCEQVSIVSYFHENDLKLDVKLRATAATNTFLLQTENGEISAPCWKLRTALRTQSAWWIHSVWSTP